MHRERQLLNHDWKFHRGDAPDARDSLGYDKLRPWLIQSGAHLVVGAPPAAAVSGDPGCNVSFVKPTFDDGTWRRVELPHDWGIEGPFQQDLPGETGKLPWQGVGWYRKHFKVKAAHERRRVFLEVDGAMAFSAFWLNGHFVGGWPYGYTSFQLDLTQHLNFGGDNVLAVRLDNPPDSSRWYPGSGLYRNVWLLTTHAFSIDHWGVFVSTPHVSPKEASINLDVTVINRSARKASLRIEAELYELSASGAKLGHPVARAHSTELEVAALEVPPGTRALRTLCARVKRPKLWSLGRTHRYMAVTRLLKDGRPIDETHTTFGVRSVAVDADQGFLLNEKPVKLQGVCMHHDQGALGTAIHTRALERQLEILQSMGCNAIRTSHNPPAPELLDLCDSMGFLVMDEAFDCWRKGKKSPPGSAHGDSKPEYFDYACIFDDWHEQDLRAMLRRDRNHPSVVMWSIGNEVIEQWYGDGWPLATHLAGIVRQEDRSRPITSAFNAEQAGYSGFQTAVDILGYNYKPWAYAELHESLPTLPLLGAETASTLSTRGEYFFPFKSDKLEGRNDFHVSSYDLYATEWATPPDQEFEAQDRCPYVAGEFVWTGFDYLGEPTPYNADATNLLNFSDPEARARAQRELEELGRISVPSRSSYFGIIDLAGFPKDRFYLYQARWRPKLKMVHILPHWTWPERIGEVTPVHVYSSADEAELFLNGESQGRRKRKRFEYRFRWDEVRYQPGELKVVTYKNGKRWAVATQHTAGHPEQLLLEPDRSRLRADGSDLCFVTVTIADAAGRRVPRADDWIQFRVSGPAEIAAVDNGDPTSFEPFQARERRAFNGLALVILRAKRGRGGRIELVATAAGHRPSKLTIDSSI